MNLGAAGRAVSSSNGLTPVFLHVAPRCGESPAAALVGAWRTMSEDVVEWAIELSRARVEASCGASLEGPEASPCGTLSVLRASMARTTGGALSDTLRGS